jgi:hypothetical protein
MNPLLCRSVGHLVAAALCVTVAGCASAAGRAATSTAAIAPIDSWSPVRALPNGARIEVEHGSAASTGRFEAADAGRLVMLVDGTRVEIDRASIGRVLQRTHARRTWALRGLLVGAGAGAIWGAVSTVTNQVPWSLTLGAGWGGLGAVIGALTAPERHVVVYRAP